jgi:hypothetical protein
LSRRAAPRANRSYPWSEIDPERRNSVLLIGGIAVVIVFAITLMAYGYYTDRIAPEHETVIQVGNRNFDFDDLERRAKAEFTRGTLDTSDLARALLAVVSTIQREELVRQTAASMGVTVTEAEIEERYLSRLQLGAEATREQLATRLRSELIRLDLSLDEYREIVVADLLNNKIRGQFEASVPTESEHVDLRLIETETQAAILQARNRLDGGEQFGFVAVALSTHASAQASGGDLSWVPRASLPKEVGDIAFSIPLDTRSEVIETSEAFYIIQAIGRETRPVESAGKTAIIQQQVDQALIETRERVGVTVTLEPEQIQQLALSVSTAVG